MTDRPSPQVQLWSWPPAHLEPGRVTRSPAPPADPVRIGDAERDRAVSSLGDHFAAGRLTREEFDTRADQAMAARFDADLQPLFADLPRTQPVPSRPTGPTRLAVVLPLLFWWLPLLLAATVVVAVLLSAPWLIWAFCWVLLIGAFWGRPRRRRHYY
jgi:hypothetical protein